MQLSSATAVPHPKPVRKLPFEARARSVPYKRPYVVAILASALFYLALIGTLAAIFSVFAQPARSSGILFVVLCGMSVLFWLLSYALRRQACCPLCKGTPFLDNSARYHEKSVRFFPLNHGTSNVIRALACQHFRCQFCGTPFDLLKPVARQQIEDTRRGD